MNVVSATLLMPVPIRGEVEAAAYFQNTPQIDNCHCNMRYSCARMKITRHIDVRWFAAGLLTVLSVTFVGTALSSTVATRVHTTVSAAADRSITARARGGDDLRVKPELHVPRIAAREREERREQPQRKVAASQAKSANRAEGSAPAQKADNTGTIAKTSPVADILRARLSRLVAPFELEADPDAVLTACRSAHGIWSQNPGRSCQLPGGRLVRFYFDSARLVGISLSHVGRSPVPLLTAAAIEELDALSKQHDGTWKVSATSERVSLQRR